MFDFVLFYPISVFIGVTRKDEEQQSIRGSILVFYYIKSNLRRFRSLSHCIAVGGYKNFSDS